MAGNGNEPDTTHASVGQFDDIDETILSMLEKTAALRCLSFRTLRDCRFPRCNRACRNWNVVM